MRGRLAAWRMSDVAAYDIAVELANTLTAELIHQFSGDAGRAATEINALRTELYAVDPSDRTAVEELVASFEERIESMPR